MAKDTPKVGIGVIIKNAQGKILIGKRKGNYVPFYSIPGGNLEIGETFEKAAIREIKEETNLTIKNPRVIAVTNNLQTYKQTGLHYISVVLYTDTFSGKPKVMEPEKCEAWIWCDPKELPKPHFDASIMSVECYLKNKVYVETPSANLQKSNI